jgi:hypothetical protein
MGVAAFVIAVVTALAMSGVFVYAGFLQLHGAGKGTPAVMMVGLLIIGCCLLHLVGVGLAIAGLCEPGRRKVFPILGLVLNGAILLITVGVILLGLAMRK